MFTELKNGIQILTEWLGDGAKVVAPEISQARSDVCTGRLTGKVCPHNQPGYRPIEAIANVIREQVEKKNELKLEVVGEKNLHTCKLCQCYLKLKVHVPRDTILDRTPDWLKKEFADEYPPCWMNNPEL